jgi:hypothetical protein
MACGSPSARLAKEDALNNGDTSPTICPLMTLKRWATWVLIQ